jgi:hypothetical protein
MTQFREKMGLCKCCKRTEEDYIDEYVYTSGESEYEIEMAYLNMNEI